MKIPKSIKVGGHTIKVVYPYYFKERTDITGQYDHDVKEIRISGVDGAGNERVDSSIYQVFLHELFHAIDFVSGHMLFTENEKALDGITEGFYQVLVDNKALKLFDYAKTIPKAK